MTRESLNGAWPSRKLSLSNQVVMLHRSELDVVVVIQADFGLGVVVLSAEVLLW